MLADRIRDYLLICVTASSRTHNATEFTSGHISISNSEDDASSVVRGEKSGCCERRRGLSGVIIGCLCALW